MKSFWFQLIGLFIVILATTFLAFNQKYLTPFTKMFGLKGSAPVASQKPSTEASNHLSIVGSDGQTKATLAVELADDKDKRSKGLGYRQSLATDSGMLFLHDETSVLTYWMKGMEFPIDFIWIKDDTVVDTISSAAPPVPGQKDETLVRYAPIAAVNKVLETNAGFVVQNNIQKGDKIVLENK